MRNTILVYIDTDGVDPMIQRILDGTLKEFKPTVTVDSSLHGVHIPMMDREGRLPVEGGIVEFQIPNILLTTEADAERLRIELEDWLEYYTQVSVGNLYAFLKMPVTCEDYRYGWFQGSEFRVEQQGSGWKIVLPPLRHL